MNIFSIVESNRVLHVELSAASEMSFDVPIGNLDYEKLIADICQIAPTLMRYDVDMTEAYDDAFRTQPRSEDRRAINFFRRKYPIQNAQGCFFD